MSNNGYDVNYLLSGAELIYLRCWLSRKKYFVKSSL